MKAYWEYQCEECHVWTFLRDVDAVERPEDALCPEGHEAVTLSKQPFLDAVLLSILPAERVVDQVTKDTAGKGRYFLMLTDPQSGRERISRWEYKWQTIIEMLEGFRGMPAAKAWGLLDRIDAESNHNYLR